MARILGLDIGPTALRATLVQSSFRKTHVERYLQVPLTVTEPGASRRAELSEALAGLLQALGGTPDTVVAAMPGEFISLRTLELPASVAKRVGDVLPLELEALLPVSADLTVADWQPIRSTAESITVMAASVLRERVAEHLAELHALSIEPRDLAAGAVIFDGLAYLLPELKTGTVALIDLDDTSVDLCVLDQGKCAFARTLSLGLSALPRHGEQFARGIQQTLAAYHAGDGGEITQAYLSGKGALTTGAAEWLTGQLGAPVQILMLPEAPNADFERPLFARATALAARAASSDKRINLRTGPFAIKRSAGALRAHVGLLSACAAAILFSLVFSVQARRSLLLEERDALQAELTSTTSSIFGKPITEVDALDSLLKNPRAGDPLPRFDAFDVVGAVSESIPTEINHDIRRIRIEIGDDKREGRFELQGALGSIEQRDAVAAKLEQHDCLHDIERGRTTPSRGQENINYQLEAVIRCSGDPAPPKKGGKKATN